MISAWQTVSDIPVSTSWGSLYSSARIGGIAYGYQSNTWVPVTFKNVFFEIAWSNHPNLLTLGGGGFYHEQTQDIYLVSAVSIPDVDATIYYHTVGIWK